MRITLTRIVDFALWVLVLLALMRTTVLVRQRDTSEFDAIDTSATFAVILVGTMLVLLVLHPRSRRTLVGLGQSSAAFLVAYLAYAALSALWSANPAYSLFRAGEVMAMFGALFVLMEGISDWRRAERVMLIVLMTVTLLSLAQRILFHGISIGGLHTNIYTVSAGMGFLYSLAESLRADPLRQAMLRRWAGVFFLLAVLGTSAGSNIAIAIGMLILLPFLSKSKLFVIPVGLACLGVVVIMGTSEQLLSTTMLSGRSLDEVQTLTGRTHLWSAYWRAFLEQPWVGQGFAIIARLGDQYGTFATTNAHNGFIEALAGLGVIGFALLAFYSARLLLETIAANHARIAGGLGCFVALVMMQVNNNSKSILGGGYDPTIIGVFAMLAFFHVFTLRAMKAQRAALRQEAASDPVASGDAMPARP
ncbi:O-antigen ligase family protein [Aurantiacibacter poecillastricola]|uniref:O-antigen ligase family protein n=1 Tax=Aurantiacibacter poecillastricola TaxID=3064385 RepID=UPI00273D58FC|nr:O-antigen ligase family protein [Aurantiacibacter sp. 219JJ12-13]MDP5260019.1 O-antigen ligase family protein [Aurantiacibacter sp. 219JJ12-13]